MKYLSPLLEFMKKHKKLYFISVACMLLTVITTLINPLIIQITVDHILGDNPVHGNLKSDLLLLFGGTDFLKKNLWIPALIYVFFTLVRGIFTYLMGKYVAKASENTAKVIKNDLYEHIQHLSFSYHKNVDAGDLIQRCTSDIDTVRKFLSVQLIEIIRVIFMIAITLYIMISINVKLTIVAVCLTPAIFTFAFVFFRIIQKEFLISDEAEAELSTVIQENLNGVRVVKAFSREPYEISKFVTKNNSYRKKTFRLYKFLGLYWGISDFICMMQISLVLIAGTIMGVRGEITLGVMIAFSNYITMLVWPLRQFGRILADFGKALISIKRIQEILEIPREKESKKNLKPEMQGEISIQGLSFRYEDESNRTHLNNLSLEIKKGETVAIMGKTGSGKSTLVQILTGLYEYTVGSITIDGIELRDINKKWLRSNVGLVLQEPFLYSKTIEENIDLKKKNNITEIRRYAGIAALDEVILSFEKGYDTHVGEKGVTLSGGQQQRIAIARTIINKCPILIFDDSLSAVDTETELYIRKQLNKVRKNATTIIITHRMSTAMDADRIYIIDKGTVVESGSHEDLINSRGYYKHLWELQNGLEEQLKKDLK